MFTEDGKVCSYQFIYFSSSVYALSKAVKRGEILVFEPVSFNEPFSSLLVYKRQHEARFRQPFGGETGDESRRGEKKGRNKKYRETITTVEKSNREKLDNAT